MVNNFENVFANCKNLKTLQFGEQTEATIPGNLSNMFLNCALLESIDLSKFHMDYLTHLSSTFEGCTNLKEVKFEEKMNSIYLTKMDKVFKGCKSITNIDLSNLYSPEIFFMQEAFSGCESLETLYLPNVNTIKAEDLSEIFKNNKKITHLELDLFNTLNVGKLNSMFENFNSEGNVTMVVVEENIRNIKDQIPDNVEFVKPEKNFDF